MSDPTAPLFSHVEGLRLSGQHLVAERRAELGQFFTPVEVGLFMAAMLRSDRTEVRLLDPGAGVGALSAAVVATLSAAATPPRRLTVTAFEIDPGLIEDLSVTLKLCGEMCEAVGTSFDSKIIQSDFVQSAVGDLEHPCVDPDGAEFTSVILNPPYRKLGTRSGARAALRMVGTDASNLYAAFVASAIHVLADGGDLVSITPRSFCNGPYFRDFRRFLLSELNLNRIHVFESRQDAFKSDDVLQENVIVTGERTSERSATMTLSLSARPGAPVVEHRVPVDRVVHPDDPERFVRFLEDDDDHDVATSMARLPATLDDLGVTVSTGRVVDFRNRDALKLQPESGAVPLIYPVHFSHGFIAWPKPESRKPNALSMRGDAERLLIPDGNYVLVRRFSAKEEPRRVVAACFERGRTGCDRVAFENHLNYFHVGGHGLDRALARGLALYLNSTFVDRYVRQFSGHTQVNATDLRSLRYPSTDVLGRLGKLVRRPEFPSQEVIDAAVAALL